jgi:hypothetical protein
LSPKNNGKSRDGDCEGKISTYRREISPFTQLRVFTPTRPYVDTFP